jgi:1,4-dihydroxy-2-naphthoyl-CoA hydrolase
MFTYKTQIRLHDTDAAGILFFAHQFTIVHDAYEQLLEKLGFSFPTMLKKRSYFLPIVHAESDYKSPLFVGDTITIKITAGNIGETSFSFLYTIHNQKNVLVGSAKTVHVTIDKKKRTKIKLPKEIREQLTRFSKNKSK